MPKVFLAGAATGSHATHQSREPVRYDLRGRIAVVTPLDLAGDLEVVSSLAIFLLASVLAALSGLAWRRERDRRMLYVTVAYAFFALRGLFVFVEEPLAAAFDTELLEHASPFLVVIALLLFFVAVSRE